MVDGHGVAESGIDLHKLVTQIVEGLHRGDHGRCQRDDWTTDTLAEWCAVERSPIVITEGISARRRKLREGFRTDDSHRGTESFDHDVLLFLGREPVT